MNGLSLNSEKRYSGSGGKSFGRTSEVISESKTIKTQTKALYNLEEKLWCATEIWQIKLTKLNGIFFASHTIRLEMFKIRARFPQILGLPKKRVGDFQRNCFGAHAHRRVNQKSQPDGKWNATLHPNRVSKSCWNASGGTMYRPLYGDQGKLLILHHACNFVVN